MSAWVLPDHIADVLPSEARHIEELRRLYLDTARGYGYELVMPPLLEYLESLLSGTGRALDLQTFKLVDQLSGRTLGLRADTTPQVARIDAHLLNRAGVTRLCYCGPVLHTRPDRPFATREPLQFGAEIYGHAGIEADLEVLQLALDTLKAVSIPQFTVDLSDARIVPALLNGVSLTADARAALHSALAAKDTSGVQALTQDLPANVRIEHRDRLDAIQRELRDTPGCTVLLYEQTCAAEKRRRRKRGAFADPDRRDLAFAGVYAAYPWCGQQFQTPRIGHTEVRAIIGTRDEWCSVMAAQAMSPALRVPYSRREAAP